MSDDARTGSRDRVSATDVRRARRTWSLLPANERNRWSWDEEGFIATWLSGGVVPSDFCDDSALDVSWEDDKDPDTPPQAVVRVGGVVVADGIHRDLARRLARGLEEALSRPSVADRGSSPSSDDARLRQAYLRITELERDRTECRQGRDAEVDRLRARVAELETAGDRVVDLVDGESDLPGVVRDVVDDLRHAVRGER